MKNSKKIYFITGASGVGKTTLISRLKEKYRDRPWSFLHFDQIGVPPASVMIQEYGSPSAWQEAKAYEWIHKAIYSVDCEKKFFWKVR